MFVRLMDREGGFLDTRLGLDRIRGVGIIVLWSFGVVIFALFRIGSSSIVGVDCGFGVAIN